MSRPDNVFDGLDAYQNPDGLSLTTDSYLLSAFVPKNAAKSVCELCAGTGIISLILLKKGKCSGALCVDFQSGLCELAAKNARLNGLEDKMKVVCADVNDFSPEGKFDRVVCNPPYLKENTGKRAEHSERFFSLHETTADITDICKSASRALKFGGEAFFCYAPERTADLYCAMREAGIEPKAQLFIYPTVNSKPSLLLVRGIKGGKSGVCTFPAVFIYSDDGVSFTSRMESIYKNNSFEMIGL